MQIQPYQNKDYEKFKGNFGDYFRKEFGLKVSEEQLEDVCFEIIQHVENGIQYLDILHDEGQSIGFILYQVDSKQSDWCEREGWGFVREFYILKELRRKGLGTEIVRHMEHKLYGLGIKNIYLTSSDRKDFWISCGYKDAKEMSKINNNPILIKQYNTNKN